MSRRSRALRYYRSVKPVGPVKKFARGLLRLAVLLFIIYHLVFVFLIRTYSVSTDSMRPLYVMGERLLATPVVFGPRVPFTSYDFPSLREPRRGDVVIVENDESDPPLHMAALDTVVQFFTLQKVSLTRRSDSFPMPHTYIKRVIGVPGDTVRMEDFRVQIRTQGKTVFLDEREIVQREYELHIPNIDGTSIDGTSEAGSTVETENSSEFPFTGNMPAISLEDNEYLILADNRTLSSSSDNWKVTGRNKVRALVLMRYKVPF